MNDIKKPCMNCGQEHQWGVLRYRDGVPLYGARPAEGGCDSFKEDTEENHALATLDKNRAKELWAQTSFMNPQAPVATRLAVQKIIDAGKPGGMKGALARIFGSGDKSIMERQWPEFMGLMISQITDIRGAMVRDDSKFAHLVAHTDEIVEAMRDAAQLSEQLKTQTYLLSEMADRLEALENRISPAPTPKVDAVAMENFGLKPAEDAPLVSHTWKPPADLGILGDPIIIDKD